MGRHKNVQERMDAAYKILEEGSPMTVRQVFYQLVSGQVLKNTQSMYKQVSVQLRDMRMSGLVPWDWIEDRTRAPRIVSMWDDLPDFAEAACAAYRRNIWTEQETLVEVWLEKDALSGILSEITNEYRVTLNVGRGYDGWSSIHEAGTRYQQWHGDMVILYFGDFDPSGEDMVRSLIKRLSFFGTCPQIIKCALTREDIDEFNLPADVTKGGDPRSAAFVKKWGDIAVELDALPVGELRDRVRREIAARLDLDAIDRIKKQERKERNTLFEALQSF
jgi:hypothetical protein